MGQEGLVMPCPFKSRSQMIEPYQPMDKICLHVATVLDVRLSWGPEIATPLGLTEPGPCRANDV